MFNFYILEGDNQSGKILKISSNPIFRSSVKILESVELLFSLMIDSSKINFKILKSYNTFN